MNLSGDQEEDIKNIEASLCENMGELFRNQFSTEDMFLFENEQNNGSNTPKFGDTSNSEKFKFLYRNEKQKSKFVFELNKALILRN